MDSVKYYIRKCIVDESTLLSSLLKSTIIGVSEKQLQKTEFIIF